MSKKKYKVVNGVSIEVDKDQKFLDEFEKKKKEGEGEKNE